ncbi:TPA: PilL N-terminal domain-containing protein [Pseudomonas aeruginosa]
MPPIILPQHLICGALLAAAVLAGGCSTTPAPASRTPDSPTAESTEPSPEYIPVARQGRYTLVELAPAAAQRDLLLQVIDVSMPADAHASVGDGLRHVLKRSGYRLCDDTSATRELYLLPLPLAHQRLGPMTLRDALLTLAGPAWAMRADDRVRRICFDRVGATHVAAEATEAADRAGSGSGAVQVFPLGEGAQP